MAEFLADQNLGLIIGGIIAEIFESEFEKILNNDHTGVADDVGAVICLDFFMSRFEYKKY